MNKRFCLSLILLSTMLLAACSLVNRNANGPAPTIPPYTLMPTFLPQASALASTPAASGGEATVIASPPAPSPTAPAATVPAPTAEAQIPPTDPSPSAPASAAQPAQISKGKSVSALPNPGGFTWQAVAEGLDNPVDLADAGDGSGRLFIIQQSGQIVIIQNGQALPTPYLDIQDRVGSQGSEQGLLGLVFDPGYLQNGYFYVNYTDKNGDTHISRFTVSANPNIADPATEKNLLYVKQPYPNHNGGGLKFGPDGFLYIGLGDGGSGGDPHGNGQSLRTFLGKLLRIDVEHGDPYAIPADNPFTKGNKRPEIWAYGLRNPWRFTFDLLTGDLYIADVGQDEYEEIDFLPAGSRGGTNFGWNYREGLHPYAGDPPAGLKLTDPVAEYSHSEGGCSVTGGEVYRGTSLPEWLGVYFYGDYCSGKVWGLLHKPDGSWQDSLLFETSYAISSFGIDQSGEVYLVDRNGTILKLAQK